MSGFARFTVAVSGCELAARSYAPEIPAHPGVGVLLLHGYLSSADMFDVDGLEIISIARRLRSEGFHVITYDQRGGGQSVVEDWAFGMGEHALKDLPAIVAAAVERFGFTRMVLAGYSLGGTIWLRYLRSRSLLGAGAHEPPIACGVAIASPATFDRGFAPWSDLLRRGRAFVAAIDQDGDRSVSRAEFTAAQTALYWKWAAPLLRPALVERNIRAAARSQVMAGLLRRLPIPSLAYDAGDFDDRAFMHVLRSRAFDRGSHQLLLELFDEIGQAPTHVDAPIDLEVLCIGSRCDKLVPLKSVEGFSRSFTRPTLIATEQSYGVPSGHAGYFFKDGVRERVFCEIRDFLVSKLARALVI